MSSRGDNRRVTTKPRRTLWPRTVRGRAVVATAIAITIFGLVLGLATLTLVTRQAASSQREVLAQRVSDVAEQVKEGGAAGDLDLGTSQIPNPVLLQLVGRDGAILGATPGVPSTARLCPTPLPTARQVTETVVDVGNGPEQVIREFRPFDASGLSVCAVLSQEPVQRAGSLVLLALLIVLPLTVAGVCVAVWWAVGRALTSVESLRSQAESLAATDDMVLRVDPTGDEVEDLGTTLNALLAELHQKSRSTRQFIADAGHELRTPLTTMRVSLEFGEGGTQEEVRAALDEALHDLDRLEALVQELLALARADAMETRSHFEPIALDALVREAVASVQRVRPEVTVEAATVPVTVSGDGAALRSLVDNLLANAVRHAADHVCARLALSEGGSVLVSIDDDGAGLAAEDCERVFERFVRLNDARERDSGGSGLGLAIVASVATAHGGQAWAEPGPGGHIRVRLPQE